MKSTAGKFPKWAAMDGPYGKALELLRQAGSNFRVVGVQVDGDNEVPRLIFLHPDTANPRLLHELRGMPAFDCPRFFFRGHKLTFIIPSKPA